ncbi:Ligand-binding SRPBCC domain-containing protein [Natronorubrum sediminis]|uniref:Ligand-binding SRPBCC domain-containing protein n=1 Tax=Natronorubrum sediminis TaxID=640943 RepID=A0A1H6FQZ1_9EURY|nr:SRPBCC family protein [Natronorubrum sediminis]SEH12164.1 Ligand-binding SRPBCC domain-containing protein [Natronorubrum sediminis]
MATYERQTTVDAPLEDVWQFHSRIGGLEALTPDWTGLRVEGMIGPDGNSDIDVLEAGTEISLSMRPFGIGPRQYLTSVIVDRERDGGVARFRDGMAHGPFEHWLHTHTFVAEGNGTVVRDHVEYELPYRTTPGIGRLVAAATPFSWVGFEATFRYRHRLTKDLLE